MKLFHLYRSEDVSGISGTGPVVEGVEFTNGWCAIRWLSNRSTLCFYQSMNDVRAIHGHGQRTELVVHDFEPVRRTELEVVQSELFLRTLEEISGVVNSVENPETTRESLHGSMEHIKSLLDDLELRLSRRLAQPSGHSSGGKKRTPAA